MRALGRLRGVVLAAAALTATGCAQAGALGDVLGGWVSALGGRP